MNEKYIHKLPPFQPYEKIKIGSNIIGAVYLLNISGFCPIIIGKADIPQIWLYINMNGVIIPLMEKNIAKTAQIKMTQNISIKYIGISIFDFNNNCWVDILNLSYAEEIPYISLLDLRPLGIDFHSDNNTMYFGNNSFSNMTIIGANVFIGTR